MITVLTPESERCVLAVYDDDRGSKDDLLGWVEFDVADVALTDDPKSWKERSAPLKMARLKNKNGDAGRLIFTAEYRQFSA